MHCLPVRRNVAVADEVLDGPRSVVQREAYNRLVVQMAVLYQMLQRNLSKELRMIMHRPDQAARHPRLRAPRPTSACTRARPSS